MAVVENAGKIGNLADAVMMDFWPIKSGYDLEKFMQG